MNSVGNLSEAQKRLLALLAIMVIVVFAASALATWLLYSAALDQERLRLQETAQSQARLIEAIARFDAQYLSESFSGSAAEATLSQIVDSHGQYEGFGETGEFTLARREGDQIVFLLSHRHSDVEQPEPIPWESTLAAPMRAALLGQSGTMIGLDYRGAMVLAAFEPIEELDFGIVAKIDMAEVRAPFFQAMVLGLSAGGLILILGSILFRGVATPLVERDQAFGELSRQAKILEQAEQSLANAQRIAHLGSWQWNIQTGDLRWSDEIFRIFGITPQQFEATYDAFLATVHPDDRQAVRDAVDASVNEDLPYDIIHRIVRPSGDIGWVHEQGEIIRGADGTPEIMNGTVHDVTEQTLAEEALRESEELLRKVMMNAADAIVTIDEKGIIQTNNAAAEAIFGWQADELQGQPVTVLMPQPDRSVHDGLIQNYINSGIGKIIGTGPRELDAVTKDGRGIPIEIAISVANVGPRRLFVGIMRDITERKRTGAALRESEERYARAVAGTNDGIWDWNIPENKYYFSPRWAEILGDKVEDLEPVIETVTDRIHPDDKERVANAAFAGLNNNAIFDLEYRMRHNDGHYIWIQSRGQVTPDEQGAPQFMAGSITDISDRREADEALRQSELSLANAQRIARMGGWTWDVETDVVWWSDENFRIYDLAPQEVSPNFEMFMEFVHPDDRKKVETAITAALVDGTPYEVDHRIILKSGETRTLRERGEVERDQDGKAIGMTGTVQDVTERVQAEQDRQLALIRAEEASQAKSEFLASISHELRTPLNAILGFSEILSLQYLGPLGEKKYEEYAIDIHASATHLLSLVNDLLDISAIEAGEQTLMKTELAIDKVVADCVKTVDRQARDAGIHVSAKLPADLPPLHADKRALTQILLNLIQNAIKFTPAGGNVSVTAEAVKNRMVICVADTGKGIPEEALSELTKPFARAEEDPHKAVEGWGLGLAITKSLVELHAGELKIESTVGKGTSVVVTLPLM